jgi:Holliday junction DNA helicase RuvA
VLDVLTPAQLAEAVANEDKTAVSRASGVGPKLAVRILTELKGKIIQTADFGPLAAKGAAPVKPSISGEAVAALLGLGINDTQARLAVEAAIKTLRADAELPVLIRTALKNLGK